MMCLENIQDVRLWGVVGDLHIQYLAVAVKRCSGEHCKSEAEIDEFISKHPYIMFFFNDQKYQPDVYWHSFSMQG